MRNDQLYVMPHFYLRSCRILLPFSWICGLISGIAFSYCSGNFASLMRGAVHGSVSIVGLGAVLILPYLLSAFAVFAFKPGFLIPLAFCKAFLFGACAAAVDQSYGNSGWMIRMLLLFSDLGSLPVLFWLWIRSFSPDRHKLFGNYAAGFLTLLLIGSIDYLVIAPFLATVI